MKNGPKSRTGKIVKEVAPDNFVAKCCCRIDTESDLKNAVCLATDGITVCLAKATNRIGVKLFLFLVVKSKIQINYLVFVLFP